MADLEMFSDDEVNVGSLPTDAPEPYATLLIHFAIPEDREAFERATGITIPITKVIWYPAPPSAKDASRFGP